MRQKDPCDALHTRVMSSADCNTDHKLCRTKVRLNIKPAVRKRGVQVKKLDTNRHLARKSEFEEELQTRQEKKELPVWETDPKHHWQQLKTILQKAAEKVGGLSTRKHKDWFDENDAEIQKLLQAKRSCHTKFFSRPDDHATKTAYRTACSYI